MSGFVLGSGPERASAVPAMSAVLGHRGDCCEMRDAGGTRVALLSRRDTGHFRATIGTLEGITAFIEGRIENAAILRSGPSGMPLAQALAAEYRRRGERVLADLRGAFIAGVLDEESGRLLLVRSAPGQRPAYYWQNGDSFAAASEVKGVLEHPACLRRLDPVVLGHLLVTGVEPHDRSLAAGVRKLPPGRVLEFAPGSRARTRLLAPVRLVVGSWGDAEGAADALHAGIDAAVASGLGGHDAGVGVFLSGGVDSYLVGESIARQGPGRGRAGTAGVEGDAADELSHAAARAGKLGLPHIAAPWTSDPGPYTLLDLLDASVRATEQPGRYENALLIMHLLRQWPDLPPVFFSGDMADVLFGDAYGRALDRAELLQTLMPWRAVRRTLGLLDRLPLRRARALAGLAAMERHDFRLYFGGLMRHDGADRLLGFDPVPLIQESFSGLADEAGELTRSQRYSYVHLRTSGQGSIDKLERLVSATGSDLIHPFLADDVYRLSFGLPRYLKYRRGATKIVPRTLARRTLPHDVVWGSRRGFRAPRSAWVQHEPSIRGAVDALRGTDARVRAYVDEDVLDRMIESLDEAGGETCTDLLWVMLSAELWCRHFQM